jgi:hypothetical protein
MLPSLVCLRSHPACPVGVPAADATVLCNICHDPEPRIYVFEPSTYAACANGHVFHAHCLSRWIDSGPGRKCPDCSRALPDDVLTPGTARAVWSLSGAADAPRSSESLFEGALDWERERGGTPEPRSSESLFGGALHWERERGGTPDLRRERSDGAPFVTELPESPRTRPEVAHFAFLPPPDEAYEAYESDYDDDWDVARATYRTVEGGRYLEEDRRRDAERATYQRLGL